MNSSIVLDPVISSSSKNIDRRLNMMVKQAANARIEEGLPSLDIFEKAFSEKGRLETGKCAEGETYFSAEDFGSIQLGLGGTNSHLGNVTYADIKNGITTYSIFLFCPKESSKISQFLEELVSNASPRTLLLTVVNSLQSDWLNRNDRILLGMFYKQLNQMMDLKFGRILLALSTPMQLKTMLAQDLPYITEYAQEIERCTTENNCTGITALINTIGE